MADSSYCNAMTEIALALAMAFFSIMVLTMVSMSAVPEKSAKAVTPQEMKVVANKPGVGNAAKAAPKNELLIFWNGRFLDRDLKPVDPNGFEPNSRIVLAMPPDLPMGEALAVRARFAGQNTLVSALDARWLNRLRALGN